MSTFLQWLRDFPATLLGVNLYDLNNAGAIKNVGVVLLLIGATTVAFALVRGALGKTGMGMVALGFLCWFIGHMYESRFDAYFAAQTLPDAMIAMERLWLFAIISGIGVLSIFGVFVGLIVKMKRRLEYYQMAALWLMLALGFYLGSRVYVWFESLLYFDQVIAGEYVAFLWLFYLAVLGSLVTSGVVLYRGWRAMRSIKRTQEWARIMRATPGF